MWTKLYWQQIAERALKAFAQTLLALITVEGFDLAAVDWRHVLTAAAFATGYSVLTSFGSTPIGPGGTPSLTLDPAVGRLAAAARGLVTASKRAVEVLPPARAATAEVLDQRTQGAEQVLADLGQAKP